MEFARCVLGLIPQNSIFGIRPDLFRLDKLAFDALLALSLMEEYPRVHSDRAVVESFSNVAIKSSRRLSQNSITLYSSSRLFIVHRRYGVDVCFNVERRKLFKKSF